MTFSCQEHSCIYPMNMLLVHVPLQSIQVTQKVDEVGHVGFNTCGQQMQTQRTLTYKKVVIASLTPRHAPPTTTSSPPWPGLVVAAKNYSQLTLFQIIKLCMRGKEHKNDNNICAKAKGAIQLFHGDAHLWDMVIY